MKLIVIVIAVLVAQPLFAKQASRQKTFRGFKIVSDAKNVYKKAGVKVGETVIMFDGQPLATPQDAMTLYQALKKKTVKQILVGKDNEFRIVKFKK
mgnify:CR=1 FL=1